MLVAKVLVVFPVPNEKPPGDWFEKLNPPDDGIEDTGLEVEDSVVVVEIGLEKGGKVGMADVTPGFPKLN